jgi:hypothetical protein
MKPVCLRRFHTSQHRYVASLRDFRTGAKFSKLFFFVADVIEKISFVCPTQALKACHTYKSKAVMYSNEAPH